MTSVKRGGSVSRLNFLSATVCVDLAEQLLRSDRARAGRKILIVSPYRPHAKLVNLLLAQAGLRKTDPGEEDEVFAGTALSFLGREADAVILDLVVDEPHWKANLFIPEASEEIRRLLNVALTRARRRLIIVGDFTWCAKCGNNSFLGRELIPFLLEHYPRIEAIQILPEGLTARAAKSHIGTLGGDVEPTQTRLVVTQQHFYQLLYADIGRAKNGVVIYSPFLTAAKADALKLHLRAAFERGVKLFIVTKPLQERGRREVQAYIEVETALRSMGVTLIHKEGMHEKAVFLDESILWFGSLNTLSHNHRTQEAMVRYASTEVFSDFAKTLRLAELLTAFDGEPERCPIHNLPIIAAEGGKGDPFYWKCPGDECFYKRAIDEPSLQDGMIRLKCDTPPELGWWNGKPIWACTCGRHHRQRVHPDHLRLPNMKALICKTDLKRLEKLFGRTPSGDAQQPLLGIL